MNEDRKQIGLLLMVAGGLVTWAAVVFYHFRGAMWLSDPRNLPVFAACGLGVATSFYGAWLRQRTD